MINIISYSGGADSTAVLVYCRENHISYEEVVYSEDWFWNKRFGVKYQYWYPIFKFADAKTYCNIHGVKINPLYNIHGVRRLGCNVCYKCGELRWKPKDEQQKFLDSFLL